MSTQIKREIICPKCAKEQRMIMVTGINNIQSPQYKEKILKESFFDFRCKGCSYISQMVYPLVYMDSRKSYMIALTPTAENEEGVETNPKIKELLKRKVKTIAELKEKILILDEGLNDVAVEMVKNSFFGIIKNTYKVENLKMYFSHINEDGNMEFAIFTDEDKQAKYYSTKIMVYKQSVEVLRSINYNYKEEDDFLKVDLMFVRQLLKDRKEKQ